MHLRKKCFQISGIPDPDYIITGFFEIFETLSDMVHLLSNSFFEIYIPYILFYKEKSKTALCFDNNPDFWYGTAICA